MATGREEKLGKAPLNRLMLTMGIPTMAAQFINILYNIVDRIYIGHIPGVESAALTGVGVTLPLITFVAAFSYFVGAGGAPLSAIWLGKGDHDHAERILGGGAWLLGFFSISLMTLFYLFQTPLLYYFGASDGTIGYARTYFSWYLTGTIFTHLTLGLNPYIIFQGQASVGMLSILIGTVLNLILDPLFIFVFKWGVAGAAIATVLSQIVSAVWIVSFLQSKRSSLRIRRKYLRPDWKIIKNVCSLGISPFVMRSTESLIAVVMNRGLQTYGGDLYVGSLTIMLSVTQLFSSPLHGFRDGIQPIISYNYGAGQFERVRGAYRRLITICGTISFLSSGACMIWPEVFARVFTNDPLMITLVKEKLPLFVFGMLFFGVQMGIQPTFVALGQAKLSVFIAMNRKVFLLAPLAAILPMFYGVDGVYWAEPIADTISAATAVALFLYNINRILSKEVLDHIE